MLTERPPVTKETRIKIGLGNKGKKISEQQRMSLSITRMGENNPFWKGDNVGLTGLHRWIKRHKPKTDYCEQCHVKKPFDLANISQKYLRDINDFEWLCRKCHMSKDGRLMKFVKTKYA
jgi:hypothetical protein